MNKVRELWNGLFNPLRIFLFIRTLKHKFSYGCKILFYGPIKTHLFLPVETEEEWKVGPNVGEGMPQLTSKLTQKAMLIYDQIFVRIKATLCELKTHFQICGGRRWRRMCTRGIDNQQGVKGGVTRNPLSSSGGVICPLQMSSYCSLNPLPEKLCPPLTTNSQPSGNL